MVDNVGFERLESLDPEWVAWLCEARAQGASRDHIEAVLKDRGDEQPALTLSSLERHPIFQWAVERHLKLSDRAKRAECYVRLHDQLWGGRDEPLRKLQAPAVEEFFNHYYFGLRPVIIQGWADTWSALEAWDPQRWVERFAEVEIEVSAGRDCTRGFDRRFNATKSMTTLGDFARDLLTLDQPSNDRYLIARNHALDRPELASLLDDIDERPYLDPQRRSGSMALWFGPRGTITPLHHDTCQIMFVQLRGEKEFVLIPPHAQGLFDQSTHMYSDLDPRLDLIKHPQHHHQLNCILRPGDALFIPVGWWHAVRSLSLSQSLAMTHFIVPNQFDWYRPGS